MCDPICGIEYKTTADIETDQHEIFKNQQFAFVALPLSDFNVEYTFKPLEMYNYQFEWGTKVIGVVPSNVNVDSPDPMCRTKSTLLLNKCLKLACYIGTNTVMMSLDNDSNTNLARIVSYHLHDSHGKPMWFRIAVKENSEQEWHRWNTFLSLLPSYQNKVAVVLELGDSVPSDEDMSRWYSEVVLGVSISTEHFISNKSNFPVLRRELQQLIKQALKNRVQVIVHGPDLMGEGIDAYQKYIYHLYESRAPLTVYEDFSRGYEELLQIPLQPLKDNLDNATYEVCTRCVTGTRGG